MSIAIIGAHRTGKTTLAAAVAEKSSLPFVKTSVSEVFRSMGLDPAVPMSFANRLSAQNAVLDHCIDLWRTQREPFITDRTPLDMAAYLLADISTTTGLQECGEVEVYLARCFEATNLYFSTLVLLQPGLPLVLDASKLTATLNPAYIEHLNSLLMGLMYDPRCKSSALYVRRDVLKLEDRVNAVIYAITRSSMIAREVHGYAKGEAVVH